MNSLLLVPILEVKNACAVWVQAEAGRSKAVIPARVSRKIVLSRLVRVAPSQRIPIRGFLFDRNVANRVLLGEMESTIAKAGLSQALTRLHSVSGLKKVLHRRARKPQGLELNIMYLGSISLCSLRRSGMETDKPPARDREVCLGGGRDISLPPRNGM